MAQITLPVGATIIFLCSLFFELYGGEIIIGVLITLDALLGIILLYSSRAYVASDIRYDGSLDIEDLPSGKKVYSLNLESDPNGS